ncbi:MAG TPA: hypothetical protein VF173_27605 [Thermoanaerobaculia bacterium]|nr:hypothetical protein [Thermoanaerobaculia bacterium]
MSSTADTRSDWKWLEGTYWYCAADCMAALQGQGTHSFGWVIDQTVWSITGYWDGYFWGVASTLLTKIGETPDPAGKKDMTFLASITPDGQVHVTFIRSAVSDTVGTGRVTSRQEKPSFEMQMSSGPGAALTVHWAFMVQVRPGDPEWTCLPGAGVSVEAMVGDIEPPTPIPPG